MLQLPASTRRCITLSCDTSVHLLDCDKFHRWLTPISLPSSTPTRTIFTTPQSQTPLHSLHYTFPLQRPKWEYRVKPSEQEDEAVLTITQIESDPTMKQEIDLIDVLRSFGALCVFADVDPLPMQHAHACARPELHQPPGPGRAGADPFGNKTRKLLWNPRCGREEPRVRGGDRCVLGGVGMEFLC